jgi:hypothetical protein
MWWMKKWLGYFFVGFTSCRLANHNQKSVGNITSLTLIMSAVLESESALRGRSPWQRLKWKFMLVGMVTWAGPCNNTLCLFWGDDKTDRTSAAQLLSIFVVLFELAMSPFKFQLEIIKTNKKYLISVPQTTVITFVSVTAWQTVTHNVLINSAPRYEINTDRPFDKCYRLIRYCRHTQRFLPCKFVIFHPYAVTDDCKTMQHTDGKGLCRFLFSCILRQHIKPCR